MATLVVNAPKYQVKARSYYPFSDIMKKGIARGYALNSTVRPAALGATKIIVLDKSARKKATGLISKIVSAGAKAGNGIPRFDIHISDLQQCAYKSEALNRNGVAIL